MERVRITASAEETERLGEDLARDLRSGDVVALVGELGAGKTTFVKGLARGLFVREDVISPSFLLARTYEGTLPLHHLDLYRLGGAGEMAEAGLLTYLPPEEGVTVVEWADRALAVLPSTAILVKFEHLGNNRRRITVRSSRRSPPRRPRTTPRE